MFRKIIILFFCLLVLTLPTNFAQAGFGVSPTYVKSEILRPGTQYERKINLLRSSADEDLEAHITIDVPEIGSWITVDKGLTFVLPKGQLRVPMTVQVAVPPGADLGDYSGQIGIATAPAKDWAQGMAVSVGALIDLNLAVTNEVFSDFKIREVKIPDFEALGKPWNNRIFSWLFRRLRVVIRIENTGNVEVAPSKVALDIYGVPANERFASLVDSDIEKIKPYETREVTVAFPSKLGGGQYWGRVKIYRVDEVLYNDQMIFTVADPGTLENYSTWSKIWPWLFTVAVIIFIALGIALSIAVIRNRVLLILSKLWRSWRVIKQRVIAVWLEIKFKFWRWLRAKSGLTDSKKYRGKK